jgi:PhnB protein
MKAKFMAYIDGTLEALDFYCKAFNATTQNVFKDADDSDYYAHAEIIIGEQAVLGISERSHYGLNFTDGSAMQFWLLFNSEEPLQTAYNVLSENAKLCDLQSPSDWCDVLADVTDKYGIRWMLSYAK